MFELPQNATEPEFVDLLAYWRRMAPPPRRLPGRQHLDPLQIPTRILPRILLFDVVPTATVTRFRFRVAGTAFGEMFGAEVTGQYLDEIAPAMEAASYIAALYAVVETGRPAFLSGPLLSPSKDYEGIKLLCLPLARDGAAVDMILASFLPIRRAGNALKTDNGIVATG